VESAILPRPFSGCDGSEVPAEQKAMRISGCVVLITASTRRSGTPDADIGRLVL